MKRDQIKYVVRILVLAVFVSSIFFFGLLKDPPEPKKTSSVPTDYWKLFAQITKERRYVAEAESHFRIPIFTPELEDLSGQEIKLVGYFLPYSQMDSVIILSRYPYANCFFCGNAGIESVAMVEMRYKKPQYQTDQRLVAKGKLALNSTNINKLAFVIEDASVEDFKE